MAFDVLEYRKKKEESSVSQKGDTSKQGFDVLAYRDRDIFGNYNALLNSYTSTYEGYQTRFGKDEYRADTEDYLSSITDARDSYASIADSIRRSAESYGSQYDADAVADMLKNLDLIASDYEHMVSSATADRDLMSQFKGADDYRDFAIGWLQDGASLDEESIAARQARYDENEARIAEIEAETKHTGFAPLDIIINKTRSMMSDGNMDGYKALKDELEALKAENTRYDREQGKLDSYFVPRTDEFLANAAKRDYVNPTDDEIERYMLSEGNAEALAYAGYYPRGGKWYDKEGNVVDIATDAEKPVFEDKLAYYLEGLNRNASDPMLSTETRLLINQYMAEGRNGSWEELKDSEIDIYYDLLAREGQEAAYQFLEDMRTTLNKRSTQKMVEGVDESNKGFGYVANNIGSVGANIIGGGIAFVDDAIHTLTGREINPYSKAHTLQNWAQAVRSDTAEDIDAATGGANALGFSFGDAYQALMSGADSLAGAFTLGGTGYSVLMGMGAASSQARDLYERGASMGQIAAGSLLAGAAEMVFEKVSIESLLKNTMSSSLRRTTILNILKQGVIEASEEFATEVANMLSDAIVMGNNTALEAQIQQYMDEGMSRASASARAVGGNVWEAFVGGFISGGGMSIGSSVKSTIDQRSAERVEGAKISSAGAGNTLRALAYEMAGGGTRDTKQLKRIAESTTKKASDQRLGRLSLATQEVVDKQNKADIKNAIISAGYSKAEAAEYADYLYGEREISKDKVAKMSSDDALKTAISELYKSGSVVNERTARLLAARMGIDLKNANVTRGKGKAGEIEVKRTVDVTDRVAKGKVAERLSTGDAVTIDRNNAIAKVETVDGERVVYYNTDKGVVPSTDIAYASVEDGILYESFDDLNPAIANAAIKNYDGKMDVSTYVDGMREGIVVYGANNFQAVGKDISIESSLASLNETDQAFALGLGRQHASILTNLAQEAVQKRMSGETTENTARQYGDGKVRFEKGAEATTKNQRRAVALASAMARAIGIDIVFYDDTKSDTEGGDERGRKANGYYSSADNSIHLDLQKAATDRKTIVFTLSHELVHFIKDWSPTKFKKFADFLMEKYAEHGVSTSTLLANKMAALGTTDADLAYEEMIADACERMLLDSNAAVKLAELRNMDKTLFAKIKEHLENLLRKIRAAYRGIDPNTEEGRALQNMEDVLSDLHALFEDAAVDAAKNYQEAASLMDMGENTDIVPVESVVKHSYKSLANAAGFEARVNEDGTRSFVRDNNAVSEVTVEDIENSPIGAFINYSLDKGDIDEAQATRQKQMFADICTMACKTNDFSMAMQFVGSAVFTGMKANADKQYGTTYDFPSICTKTQAVIDAMSARMVKLGRGLNKDEILNIYNEVFNAGNPVPCPECYVFSRWIGIGGLLDNIKKYQDYYGKMSVEDVAKAYREMRSEVESFASEHGLSFGKAKGALTAKLTKEYNKLKEKIEKAENQGESVKGADLKRLAELEPMMNTVKSMTWLETVYFADSALTKVNKNFNVPNEVLFDLNNGEAFATKYPEAWAFRTTQGAGYGKAITPYAEASLGEGILVTNNTSNAIKGKAKGTLNNFFLQQRGEMDANARKTLDKARLRQKIQAFLGGQRFQSTSDARYENASDYLLAALEMQAMHGMVQVYTKVDGAVPTFANWGFSINQSLMPLGGGLDTEGNVKDTHVGGMSTRVAENNRKSYENAGTITIGVNDNHIRTLFSLISRDFIIPYHASGGDASLIAEFRAVQDVEAKKDTMVRSTDYSRTQSDKVLSDDVLSWTGKSAEEIEKIHKVREARIAILTSGKVDIDVVRGNRFLSALYDKFNGGEWSGVKIAKSKVESQIYPNEFWDQSVSYEESGKITRDYLEYCEDLGFLHRFSGLVPSNGRLVPVKGYDQNGNRVELTDLAYKYENGVKTDVVEDFFWKVLTDRRMYDNGGNYLPQKIVTLNDTTTDAVTDFARNNFGRQYNKDISKETAKKVADENWDGIKKQAKTATDAEYISAVESGDLETARAMIEKAAKAAGYTEVGYGAADLLSFRVKDLVLHGTKTDAEKDAVNFAKYQIRAGLDEVVASLGANVEQEKVDKIADNIHKRLQAIRAEAKRRGTNEARTHNVAKKAVLEILRDDFGKQVLNDDAADDYAAEVAGFNFEASDSYDNNEAAFCVNTDGMLVIDCAGSKLSGIRSKDLPNITTMEDKRILPTRLGVNRWTSEKVGYYAENNGYSGVVFKNVKSDSPWRSDVGTAYLIFNPAEHVVDTTIEYDENGNVVPLSKKFSSESVDNEKKGYSSYAPTFYSKMAKVVDGIKGEKIGANSVVSYLVGKGIKKDEIKWSGIEAFLEGKKSVTKQELKDFVDASMLRVDESVMKERFSDYTNNMIHTEKSFQEAAYSNAERLGKSKKSVRIVRDESQANAYIGNDSKPILTAEVRGANWGFYKLKGGNNYRELVFSMPNASYKNQAMTSHWGRAGVLAHARIQDLATKDGRKMLFIEEIQSDWHNSGHKHGYVGDEKNAEFDQRATKAKEKFNALQDELSLIREEQQEKHSKQLDKRANEIEKEMEAIYDEYGGFAVSDVDHAPDAPFRENYQEFVMKRLLRMAAEDGYDSIGWTTAKIQSDRWSDKYSEGYRIEYDQDIPSFMRKYGKKWGATVGQTKTKNGDVVWVTDITDAMKQSVLYEGQVMFQKKQVTDRELLANALESIAQDETERKIVEEYKSKLSELGALYEKKSALSKQLRNMYESKAEPRDVEWKARSRALRDEIVKTENRIETYDRMLLKTEATKPFQKVIKTERLRAEKETSHRYQEMIGKNVSSRRDTAVRGEIKRIAGTLKNMLVNGTKEKNVKVGLQAAVAAALDTFDLSASDAAARKVSLTEKLKNTTDPEEIRKISSRLANIDSAAERVKALKEIYEALRQTDAEKGSTLYQDESEAIKSRLDAVSKKVGDTPLYDMNSEQLEMVRDVYKMVLKTVRDANKMFRKGKAEEVGKRADSVKSELAHTVPLKEERYGVGEKLKGFLWNEARPIDAFEMVGAESLTELFWDLIEGQDTVASDVADAKSFADKARDKYGYGKWDLDKVHEFQIEDGRKMRLTLRHMMSIYAYSKRPQAEKHMKDGGFFFNDKETFTKKNGLKVVKSNAVGYKVSDKTLAEIKTAMGKEVTDYVDEMQSYLTEMGENGNEASRILYGIDLFKEKVYFPLKSVTDFLKRTNEPVKEGSLKNDGMTQETKPNASNPIVLEAFDEVWSNHVNRMSQYHGLVVPIDNLNKLLNFGTWVGTDAQTVSTLITGRHTSAATDYIIQLIKDLNGSITVGGASNPLMGMFSKFKKTAVAASASVIFQQPTAIVRALAEIDAKYFAGEKQTSGRHKERWDELKKYAPIAVFKEIGGFDAGAGRQVSEWLAEGTKRGIDKVAQKVDDLTMSGAAKADEIGWLAIWDACVREVKDKQKLTDEKAIKEAAGKRFTEIIVRTQVYDSTLSRSGFMRSQRESVKFATSFMSEPTVTANMIFGTIIRLKNGKIGKAQAAKNIASAMVSQLFASLAASAIYALRDDDEDESLIEKYLEALAGKLVDEANPLNLIPFARDVTSIVSGWDVERSDTAVFGDLVDAFTALSSEKKSAWRKTEDFAGAIASMFGVPLRNVLRTFREIYNLVNGLFDGIDTRRGSIGSSITEGIKGDRVINAIAEKAFDVELGRDASRDLYDAYVIGDEARLAIYRKYHKGEKDDDRDDEDAFLDAVKLSLRDNDARITEAAMDVINGDVDGYERIVNDIIDEGVFDQEMVVGAVRSAVTKTQNANEEDEEDEYDEEETDKEVSIYRASDVNAALEAGNTDGAREVIDDLVRVKMANGAKESEAKSAVRSSLTSYWKPLYKKAYEIKDTEEMKRIRQILYSTRLYGNGGDIAETCRDWLKDK